MFSIEKNGTDDVVKCIDESDYLSLDSLLDNRSDISDGKSATGIPASRSALVFSSAVPEPMDIIAPAWPIRLPGGAARPATKETIGFRFCNFALLAASRSSASPPISPTMTIFSVSGSSSRSCTASMKLSPITGSPPIPIAVLCPIPALVRDDAIS